MKVQALLITLAVTALSTTGCCGLRNVLFGRGAACGSCAATGPAINVAPPTVAAPCGDACGGPVAPYAGELTCGSEGVSSYAVPFDNGYPYGSGYSDGGIIGNGVTYPNGLPVEGSSRWAPRGEYVVPGSQYEREGLPRPAMTPTTNMGAVNGS
ncbi:hypothetical protein [Roseimaritima ulvae]|uniref:Uncharacterized protein n=1 Tax=Roseimaritima ulvae TaxID=980254 RepID=A0A5B9QQW2_9BACT|nr:hypothetical protein [Roseimaritima ulvae]QEG40332.1 hypothetical protein UC8_23410 [Roseimaritima ulvae]